MSGQGIDRSALPVSRCLHLLAAARRGRLVTTLGALPVAEPVPYVCDDSGDRDRADLVVHVRRRERVRDGDVVSLLVDRIDERSGSGWTVLLTGRIRALAWDDDLVAALAPRATEDWLDRRGQLFVLAAPLIRGTLVGSEPAPEPARPAPCH